MPTAPLSLSDKSYLSSGQAAREIGLSEARIRQLLSSGALPSVATPLGRLVPADAVAAYARSRANRKARP
jgi:hypothetical protein